jgi:hypothetical protein
MHEPIKPMRKLKRGEKPRGLTSNDADASRKEIAVTGAILLSDADIGRSEELVHAQVHAECDVDDRQHAQEIHEPRAHDDRPTGHGEQLHEQGDPTQQEAGSRIARHGWQLRQQLDQRSTSRDPAGDHGEAHSEEEQRRTCRDARGPTFEHAA